MGIGRADDRSDRRMTTLPIHAVLPDLLAALRDGANAVLVAPPGAGKTTAVAPALLRETWCTGEILLLSPRRLAARAAAERMAEQAGEGGGRTSGYATRLDTKRSARTRLTVLTEGIFRARIQADPELAGVSAVLFDEVHERSLDSDFGLALALDAQAALRPDLRLIAMSATLDGARFAALMGGAPVIESEGRSHPIALILLGRSAEERIEDEMAAAVRRALSEAEGSLLAFLPGVAEIERTAERLEAWLPADVDLHRLHGSLEPAAQRAAIAAPSPGPRQLPPAARPPQARPRHVDRRDQPDPRRRADRRRLGPRPPPALRPRRRHHPPRHRARQPGGGDAARRPRRAAGAGPGLPAVGGSRDRRFAPLRPARNPRSRPLRLAARLRDLGRRRPARPALARPAARRRNGRSAAPPRLARRGRARRPPHPARPGDRGAAAPAPPRPHADRGRRSRLGADGGRGRGVAVGARPRRQRRRRRAQAQALARRTGAKGRSGARAGEAL